MICSKLSRMRSTSLSARCSSRASVGDRVPIGACSPRDISTWVGTTSTSLTGERSTKNTPLRKVVPSSAPTWRASRVFPVPPGPVRVRTRVCLEQPQCLRQLVLPPHEAGGDRWEIVRNGIEGVEDRELLLQPGDDQLEDRLRLRQVLEPVLPKVAECQVIGDSPLRQHRGRLGEHRLPAVGGGGDPSGPMDVDSHVVVATENPVAGVHPDARPHGELIRPRWAARARCASAAATKASAAAGNTAKKASPSVLTTVPPRSSIAWRTSRL